LIGLTISTSKRGLLWPTEHWKCLIDSLCQGGSKHDPRLQYPVFTQCLAPLVREDNGRFFPTAESWLVAHDDTAISFLRITRVPEGDDEVCLHVPMTPDIEGWPVFEFPYFGTIGSSISEAQTSENVAMLRARADELTQHPRPTLLQLHFQLSGERRDRDLDNLGDALMPFFNGLFPGLVDIRLTKGPPRPGQAERLWVSATTSCRSSSCG
jgi:hypothetical protein